MNQWDIFTQLARLPAADSATAGWLNLTVIWKTVTYSCWNKHSRSSLTLSLSRPIRFELSSQLRHRECSGSFKEVRPSCPVVFR